MQTRSIEAQLERIRQQLSRSAAVEYNFGVGNRVMVIGYQPGNSQWQPAKVLARTEQQSRDRWRRSVEKTCNQMTATCIGEVI